MHDTFDLGCSGRRSKPDAGAVFVRLYVRHSDYVPNSQHNRDRKWWWRRTTDLRADERV